MEKQTKSGKKRRSKPETLKLKNIVVGGMSKFYEQIPIILPFIFSSLEDFQIKNLELKHDIQEAMTAIKKIEELESVKKSVSPAYRSYDYYPYIDKLNRIIALYGFLLIPIMSYTLAKINQKLKIKYNGTNVVAIFTLFIFFISIISGHLFSSLLNSREEL